MKTGQYKLIIVSFFLLIMTFPAWYGINYYTAGLLDQSKLIEYGYVDDFLHCYKWRPDKFDHKLSFSFFTVQEELSNDDGDIYSLQKVHAPLVYWLCKYKYNSILYSLKLDPQSYNQVIESEFVYYISTSGATPYDRNTFEYLYFGESSIHLSSRINDESLSKFLISKGIDLNFDSQSGLCLALNYAIKNNAIEMVKVLIDAGAEINVVSQSSHANYSPMGLAAQHADINLFKYLVDSGGGVNEQLNGLYLLDIATRYGNKDVMDFLIANNAKGALK